MWLDLPQLEHVVNTAQRQSTWGWITTRGKNETECTLRWTRESYLPNRIIKCCVINSLQRPAIFLSRVRQCIKGCLRTKSSMGKKVIRQFIQMRGQGCTNKNEEVNQEFYRSTDCVIDVVDEETWTPKLDNRHLSRPGWFTAIFGAATLNPLAPLRFGRWGCLPLKESCAHECEAQESARTAGDHRPYDYHPDHTQQQFRRTCLHN